MNSSDERVSWEVWVAGSDWWLICNAGCEGIASACDKTVGRTGYGGLAIVVGMSPGSRTRCDQQAALSETAMRRPTPGLSSELRFEAVVTITSFAALVSNVSAFYTNMYAIHCGTCVFGTSLLDFSAGFSRRSAML